MPERKVPFFFHDPMDVAPPGEATDDAIIELFSDDGCRSRFDAVNVRKALGYGSVEHIDERVGGVIAGRSRANPRFRENFDRILRNADEVASLGNRAAGPPPSAPGDVSEGEDPQNRKARERRRHDESEPARHRRIRSSSRG